MESPAGGPISSSQESDTRRRTLLVASVFCLGAFVYLFDLGSYRSLTTHEGFVAVVSREMLDTGDWVVPRYGELPRLKKPPLAYWSAAASSWLAGGSSEWSVRLPSVVAALLLAALVGHWARRWYGPGAGLGAAIVQLSSLYVLTFARLAEVDMQLCLLTTAALYLMARGITVGQISNLPVKDCLDGQIRNLPHESLPRSAYKGASRATPPAPPYQGGEQDRGVLAAIFSPRWTAIYALLGLAWLAKFHYGPTMVLSVCGVYFVAQRRWSGFLHLLNPAGLLILAAALCVWPYFVLRQLPQAWDIWQAETVGRAVGQLGSDPVWYYLPQVLLLGLPWTPLTLAAVPGSWRAGWKQGDARERFLWIWFLTQFAILSASAFKHGHYLMAALPVLSLLGGRTLARVAEKAARGEEILPRRQAGAIAAACLAGAAVAGFALTKKWPTLATPAIALALLIGVGGPLLALLFHARKYAAAVGAAAAVLVGCHVTAAGWIFPGRDHRRPAVAFAEDARRELPPGENVCVFGLLEHPVVYYVREPVYRLESRDELARRLRDEGRVYAVTTQEKAAEIGALGHAETICTLHSPPQGPRYKEAPLVLVQLDAAPPASRLATRDVADAPERD